MNRADAPEKQRQPANGNSTLQRQPMRLPLLSTRVRVRVRLGLVLALALALLGCPSAAAQLVSPHDPDPASALLRKSSAFPILGPAFTSHISSNTSYESPPNAPGMGLSPNIIDGEDVSPPFRYPWTAAIVDTDYASDVGGLVSMPRRCQ